MNCCCCWPWFRAPSPPPPEQIPLMGDDALAAIFKEKSIVELHTECYNILPISNPTPVFPDNPDLDACYCVNESLILTAAPDVGNINAFFKMAYLHTTSIIILLQTRDYANFIKQRIPYFISDEINAKYGLDLDYLVSLESVSHLPVIKETILKLEPKDKSKPVREISIHHYQTWIDGTGGNPNSIAKLARIAMKAHKPIIHCWAGEGRTGTLAAVISAYRKISEGNRSPDLIRTVVENLRKERPWAVRNVEQYQSVYAATRVLLEEDGLLESLANS